MSDVKVAGFENISFWQEDGIGVIVLRSKNGNADPRIFDELVLSLSQAAIDENVKCIAFTGLNLKFLRKVDFDPGNLASLLDYLERVQTFVSVIYSIRKNVYSIVNGNAINEGFEIALLSDFIISSDLARLGFETGYQYGMLGSMTGSRFNYPMESKAEKGSNCDYVIRSDNLLEESKKLILKDVGINRYLPRRIRLSQFEKAMVEEKLAQVEKFSQRQK